MTAAWAVPRVTIALTQVAVIATSIYMHRALAHGRCECTRWPTWPSGPRCG